MTRVYTSTPCDQTTFGAAKAEVDTVGYGRGEELEWGQRRMELYDVDVTTAHHTNMQLFC